MRAVAIDGYGEPDVARARELADPEVGPGEVRVRLRRAALNHLDLWTTSGALGLDISFPFILGADGAGEIESVGEGAGDLAPGARVLVNPAISCRVCERCRAGQQSECVRLEMLGEHRNGTFAELVTVPAHNVFPMPEQLSFAEGAALGVTFMTAYRMLFTQGELRPGESVLITGVGGGLGLSLLQLARPVAGRIIVTSSSEGKLRRAQELGADVGIDYRTEEVGKAVRSATSGRGVDLVVDSAGGPTLEASLRSLVQGGRLVIAGATAGPNAEMNVRRLFWKQLRIIGSTMASDSDVAAMLRMVDGAGLRPVIDRTFPLEETAAALRYLKTVERFGKVVLEIS